MAAMSTPEPQEDAGDLTPAPQWPRTIQVTEHQAEALAAIFERDRTAWVSHGGLKGLLGITDSQVMALHDIVCMLKK